MNIHKAEMENSSYLFITGKSSDTFCFLLSINEKITEFASQIVNKRTQSTDIGNPYLISIDSAFVLDVTSKFQHLLMHMTLTVTTGRVFPVPQQDTFLLMQEQLCGSVEGF